MAQPKGLSKDTYKDEPIFSWVLVNEKKAREVYFNGLKKSILIAIKTI